MRAIEASGYGKTIRKLARDAGCSTWTVWRDLDALMLPQIAVLRRKKAARRQTLSARARVSMRIERRALVRFLLAC
jgi:hypothetical protein